MGICFRSEGAILKAFCRALGDIDIMEVNPSSVQAFLDGKGVVTAFWRQKFRVLDRFYRYSIGRGYVDSSPLPKTIPKWPESLTPHIHTAEELRRLITATDSLKTPMSPLQASTFRTLLLTLYGTGLRISEALSLTLSDVNLLEGLIVVRNGKFFKTRVVPIGPCLAAELRRYAKRRRQLARPAGESSAFFVTRSGNALSYGRVGVIFRVLRNLAAIHGKKGARYRPRIHDLRHYAELGIIATPLPQGLLSLEQTHTRSRG